MIRQKHPKIGKVKITEGACGVLSMRKIQKCGVEMADVAVPTRYIYNIPYGFIILLLLMKYIIYTFRALRIPRFLATQIVVFHRGNTTQSFGCFN